MFSQALRLSIGLSVSTFSLGLADEPRSKDETTGPVNNSGQQDNPVKFNANDVSSFTCNRIQKKVEQIFGLSPRAKIGLSSSELKKLEISVAVIAEFTTDGDKEQFALAYTRVKSYSTESLPYLTKELLRFKSPTTAPNSVVQRTLLNLAKEGFEKATRENQTVLLSALSEIEKVRPDAPVFKDALAMLSQKQVPLKDSQKSEIASSVSAEEKFPLPIPFKIREILKLAKEQRRDKDWARIVEELQRVMDGPEVLEEGRSLISEVERAIAELPKEGVEFYRLIYDPVARLMLQKVNEKGYDEDFLKELYWRYSHTAAGQGAASLVGVLNAQKGNNFVARFYLGMVLAQSELSNEERANLLICQASVVSQLGEVADKLWKEFAQIWGDRPIIGENGKVYSLAEVKSQYDPMQYEKGSISTTDLKELFKLQTFFKTGEKYAQYRLETAQKIKPYLVKSIGEKNTKWIWHEGEVPMLKQSKLVTAIFEIWNFGMEKDFEVKSLQWLGSEAVKPELKVEFLVHQTPDQVTVLVKALPNSELNLIKELMGRRRTSNMAMFDEFSRKKNMPRSVMKRADPKSFEFVSFKFPLEGKKVELGSMEDANERTVTLKSSYAAQVTPVTQLQWYLVMGKNPAKFNDSGEVLGQRSAEKVDLNRPIETISWEDAKKFIDKLSEQDEFYTYRLPTEAEWEYAARGGDMVAKKTRYSFGDDENDLDKNGWYTGNSSSMTQPVATKLPNPVGLYDMHGNVWQWMSDWDSNYDEIKKVTGVDPVGPQNGANRVLRGGSWFFDAEDARSASRYKLPPVVRDKCVGFRLVRTSK